MPAGFKNVNSHTVSHPPSMLRMPPVEPPPTRARNERPRARARRAPRTARERHVERHERKRCAILPTAALAAAAVGGCVHARHPSLCGAGSVARCRQCEGNRGHEARRRAAGADGVPHSLPCANTDAWPTELRCCVAGTGQQRAKVSPASCGRARHAHRTRPHAVCPRHAHRCKRAHSRARTHVCTRAHDRRPTSPPATIPKLGKKKSALIPLKRLFSAPVAPS